MFEKLERVVPCALVVALLVAGGGLAVQLRDIGRASSATPRAAALPDRPMPTPTAAVPESPTPSPEPEPVERLEAVPAETCAFDPVTNPGPLLGAAESARALIGAIAARVEELRELRFRDEVEPVFQDGDRMAKVLTRRIARSYTDAEAGRDELILSALGAIPRGADLRRIVARGLGGDVLGYYVPKTGKLLVQKLDGDREGLGGGEKFVLAHELEHALADQRLGLPKQGDSKPAEADRAAAGQALTEGDATITMLQFATTSLTDEERLSLATDPSLGGESSLEDAPYFVRKTFEFPYDRGADFVCALYQRGGWDAVDRAYDRPPVSSAQVLFPQDYLDHVRPKDPRNPRPPRGWQRHPVQSLGAADLLWLLQAPGGDPVRALDDPERRVMGWLGGEVHLFTHGRRSAVAMELVAKGRSGLLCDSVGAWYRVSFPIERTFKKQGPERFALASRRQAAVLRCRGGEVRLGIGPTVPVARGLSR